MSKKSLLVEAPTTKSSTKGPVVEEAIVRNKESPMAVIKKERSGVQSPMAVVKKECSGAESPMAVVKKGRSGTTGAVAVATADGTVCAIKSKKSAPPESMLIQPKPKLPVGKALKTSMIENDGYTRSPYEDDSYVTAGGTLSRLKLGGRKGKMMDKSKGQPPNFDFVEVAGIRLALILSVFVIFISAVVVLLSSGIPYLVQAMQEIQGRIIWLQRD